MVDAEFSESLDSTCPSKKGCEFADAAGESSHVVGLMVASTSRVRAALEMGDILSLWNVKCVGLIVKKICGNSDSLIFYVFVLSIIP